MDHADRVNKLRCILDNAGNHDPDTVRDLFIGALSEKAHNMLSMNYIDTSFSLLFEEEGEDPEGTIEDPVLDPGFQKEFFLKSFEVGDHVVTIKTLGVGRNKPVSVYIDERRWELFPGPVTAESKVKEYIESGMYAKSLEKKAASKPAPEAPEDEKKPEENPDEDLKENVIGLMRRMVTSGTKGKKTIVFEDGSSTKADTSTASTILGIYDELNNKHNRSKFESMANKSRSSFQKLVRFANRQESQKKR